VMKVLGFKLKIEKFSVFEVIMTFSVIALSYLFYVVIIFISENNDIFFITDEISCSLNYPKYMSTSDYRSIDITLINRSSKKIDCVQSYIYFPNNSHVVVTSEKRSLFADFGSLSAGEIRTRNIEFYFSEIKSSNIEFCFNINVDDRIIEERNYNIRYYKWFPFPKIVLRTVWGAILSSFLLIFINVVSEIIKIKYNKKSKKKNINRRNKMNGTGLIKRRRHV